MKILHINCYRYPVGGTETYLAELLRHQRDAGRTVALLTTDSRGGGALPLLNTDCPPIHCESYIARGTSSSIKAIRALIQLCNPSAYFAARNALSRFRPDIVHVHSYLGQLSPLVLLPFRRAEIPIVITGHNYKPTCPTGTRTLAGGRFCDYRPGFVCAHNCSTAALLFYKLRSIIYGSPSGWFAAMHAISGSSMEVYRQAGFTNQRLIPHATHSVRAPTATQKNSSLIIYAGRLQYGKGVHILLQAFANISIANQDLRLFICGDGPDRGDLERLVTRLRIGDKTTFYGYIDKKRLDELRSTAMVQCAPSLNHETSGLVIREGFALGLPTIASKVSGYQETIRDGVDGILVQAGDAGELGNAISRVMGNREYLDSLSTASLHRAEQENFSKHLASIDSLYSQIMARRS